MEKQDPRRGGERCRDEPDQPIRKTGREQRDQRNARDRKHERHDPERGQAAAGVDDGPGEQEVQRGAAALRDDDVDDVRKRRSADEHRERFVLVRRPRMEERDERDRDRAGDDRDSDPEPAQGEIARFCAIE